MNQYTNPWTDEEIKILKEKYLTKSAVEISKLIKKTPKAINIKASRLNLQKKEKQWTPILSKDLFYAIGAIEGDGCVNEQSHYAILFKVTDRPFAHKFYNKMKAIAVNPRPIKIIHNDKLKDCYSVNTFCKQFFIWYKNTVNYDWLLSQEKKRLLAFLEGFYEAEGCLQINGIALAGKNKELIFTVKRMFEKIGYNPTISSYTAWNGSLIWRLNLYKDYEVINFLSEINPCIKRKRLDSGKFEVGQVHWSPKEINILRKLYPTAKKRELIKALPKRGWNGISLKGQQLGIKRIPENHWTLNEEKTIKEKYIDYPVREIIKLLPNRSNKAIHKRAQLLDIRKYHKKQ